MRSIFRSTLDIKSMISILREKIPRIKWRMGDSEYDGFYVLGRTKNRIKIKVTEEDRPGIYCLGIYFYGTNYPLGPVWKLIAAAVLRYRVMRVIAAKRCVL